MDDALISLSPEDSIVGQFGPRAETFARFVATARKAYRVASREFLDRAAWRLDPKVLAVLIALEEDR
jgi:hypothetical protein